MQDRQHCPLVYFTLLTLLLRYFTVFWVEVSVETIGTTHNLNVWELVTHLASHMPGRPHDPSQFWTIVGHTGAVDVAQCNFCGSKDLGSETSSEHICLRSAMKHQTMSRDCSLLRNQGSSRTYKKTLRNEGKLSWCTTNQEEEREEKEFVEEEGKPSSWIVTSHASMISWEQETDSRRNGSTEHRARMSLMKSETAFLDTKERCIDGGLFSLRLPVFGRLLMKPRETGGLEDCPGERYDCWHRWAYLFDLFVKIWE